MKKFLACIFMLLMFSVVMFAQEITEVATDSGGGLSSYVSSFSAFAGTVIILTAFVLKFLETKIELLKGWMKYVTAFVVSLIVGAAAYLLKLGIFETTLINASVYVIGGFLISGGIFKLPLVEMLLDALKLLPAKK